MPHPRPGQIEAPPATSPPPARHARGVLRAGARGPGWRSRRGQARPVMSRIAIDGSVHDVQPGDRLIDVIRRAGVELPAVCYHPQLGPIQTCDACMVEIDGALVRACAVNVSEAMKVTTGSAAAVTARREAFDRVLANHQLYCTICDNNNGGRAGH